MSVKVTGLTDVTDSLMRTPARIVQDVRNLLGATGRNMVRDAKAFRKPPKKSIANQTDQSIESIVDQTNLVLTFRINPRFVTTDKGFNYAWGQNDGTRSNYKQGEISPESSSVGGPDSGLVHQDFMGRAWLKNLPIAEEKILKIVSDWKL